MDDVSKFKHSEESLWRMQSLPFPPFPPKPTRLEVQIIPREILKIIRVAIAVKKLPRRRRRKKMRRVDDSVE